MPRNPIRRFDTSRLARAARNKVWRTCAARAWMRSWPPWRVFGISPGINPSAGRPVINPSAGRPAT